MKESKLFKALDGILIRTPYLSTGNDKKDSKSALLPIAIGSRSLYDRLNLKKKCPKVSSAYSRYLKRMKYRPTPYGMFAGVSWGEFGEETTIERDGSVLTKTRPDMSFLLPLISSFEQNNTIRSQLKFFPNPELYIRDGYYYLERGTFPDMLDSTFIRASDPIQRIMQLSADGMVFDEIVLKTYCEFGGLYDSAKSLCNRLCENRFLISELRLTISDWRLLIEILSNLETGHEEEARVQKIIDILREIDNWDGNNDKSAVNFIDLLDRVSSVGSDVETSHFLQVDSEFGLKSNKLSSRVADELERALMVSLKLTSRNGNEVLEQYKSRFYNRYQIGREVPLLKLLDPVEGLGNPYIYTPVDELDSISIRDAKLLSIAETALHEGQLEYELSANDIESLQGWDPQTDRIPLSVDLFAGIVAESRAAIDSGKFRVLIAPRVGEIGAGKSAGRFSDLLGTQFKRHSMKIVQLEQDETDRLLVDVSYWPRFNRHANLMAVPAIRGYSINVGCLASNDSISIPLSELMIGIDEQGFYARWIRTGQKISAHSNSMLNPAYVPDSIRFLLEIARYGLPNLQRFDWGVASFQTFLPRLTHGKLILRPARWKLGKFIDQILKSKSSKTNLDFSKEFDIWRRNWRVPNQVQLLNNEHDDNLLYLNLEESEDMDLLTKELKKCTSNSELYLEEYIPCDQWNCSGDDKYYTEIVASFTSAPSILGRELSTPSLSQNSVVASRDYLRLPGTEWIYLKLNCSRGIHGELVSLLYSEFIKTSDYIKQWFFLPYVDEEDHLRVRFKVDLDKLYSTALPEIFCWSSLLVKRGLCSSFSVESYNRETERYGGINSMELVEEIFRLDSVSVAEIFSNPTLNKDLIRASFYTVFSLLRAFGFSDKAKISILRETVSSESIYKYSNEQRSNRAFWETLLSDTNNVELSDIHKILSDSEEKISQLTKKLYELEKNELLTESVNSICQSLIHVHFVRLLGLDRNSENKVRTMLARAIESNVRRLQYKK